MIETLLLGPANVVIPTTTILIVIAGMFVLAGLDVWRYEVEDVGIVALLLVGVAGLTQEGILPTQWVSGLLAAAVAFLVYLNLGMRGAVGGGDVKLAVVPAFVLGAANPIVAIWWVACSLLLHQLLIVAARRFTARPATSGGAKAAPIALPHVPAMAVSMYVASSLFVLAA